MGGLRTSLLVLLVPGTIVGGILLLPNLQTANHAGNAQLPAGWPFASARAMEPEIARVFGCTLEQTPRASHGISPRTHGLFSVDIDPMHGQAARFESMALISRDDAPRASIDAVMQLTDYLFPDWVERRTWMTLPCSKPTVTQIP